jgi:hemerythrin-like domain-containing protein
MMPIGPLMIEHRLIERLIASMKEEHRAIKEQGKVRICFVEGVIDFLQMYSDRCHHGKEETILFEELERKQLTPEHRAIVESLRGDHAVARNLVGAMSSAKDSYAHGNASALDVISECFEKLLDLYPKHIQKEDKHFFIPCMNYFDKEEQSNMLQKFWDFDKSLIHEKYRNAVQQLPTCQH